MRDVYMGTVTKLHNIEADFVKSVELINAKSVKKDLFQQQTLFHLNFCAQIVADIKRKNTNRIFGLSNIRVI